MASRSVSASLPIYRTLVRTPDRRPPARHPISKKILRKWSATAGPLMRMTGRRQIEKVRGARGLAVAEDNERRADERRLAVDRGPVPWPSQFTSEGAGLEGGEELIQRFPSAIVFSALGIDRSDSPSVFALVIG